MTFFSKKAFVIILCFSLLSTVHGEGWGSTIVTGAVVGGATVCAVPFVLGVAGFTGAGIAAGSLAAKAMSAAAIANGGAVAAGTTVALCQSIGAAGIAGTTYVGGIVGGAGVASGWKMWRRN